MKRIFTPIAAALLLLACGASAQTFKAPSQEGWVRTSATQRQSEYPKMNNKGEYWFRFRAPETAKEVQVSFAGQTIPAQK
ncbi:MAG: hypothetical protein II599_07275, partial [Bacteroidales bacterium]|nr:hypothetical protein [Bacteroidales bacterium]